MLMIQNIQTNCCLGELAANLLLHTVRALAGIVLLASPIHHRRRIFHLVHRHKSWPMKMWEEYHDQKWKPWTSGTIYPERLRWVMPSSTDMINWRIQEYIALGAQSFHFWPWHSVLPLWELPGNNVSIQSDIGLYYSDSPFFPLRDCPS